MNPAMTCANKVQYNIILILITQLPFPVFGSILIVSLLPHPIIFNFPFPESTNLYHYEHILSSKLVYNLVIILCH